LENSERLAAFIAGKMPVFRRYILMSNGLKIDEPRGWYSRGYLPHFDAGETRTQFITCRLYDSLPQNVLARIEEEIELRKPENISRETFILAEKYLDRGYGQCFLGNRSVAEIVRDSLLRYDGERYKLIAWVVMPNHIHLLLRALAGHKLEKIMHSFKSFTASESNKALGRRGAFWMRESFDRYIRNEEHFARTFRYIENNPVKAKICVSPEDWEFSSAWKGRHLATQDRGAG
jgi:REP element-mobilizing transposase RayT